jgi:Ser/Thr protein kinase RdoA (MazF antagonist)
MTTPTFTKSYDTPDQAAAAARHHHWLTRHARPLCQPALTAATPTGLTFAYVDGRHARPEDLPRLAALLGDAHGTAWITDLHRARLDTPHPLGDSHAMADFRTPREAALRRRLKQGHIPDQAILTAMLTLLDRTADGPAAFYKDSNPRTFLLTPDGTVFAVDTDDLTLAPFGYDLAKLIVTLFMTYGPVSDPVISTALTTYNEAAARHDPSLGATGRERLADFLALHAVLTAPYAGRNGYHCTGTPA